MPTSCMICVCVCVCVCVRARACVGSVNRRMSLQTCAVTYIQISENTVYVFSFNKSFYAVTLTGFIE